MNDDVSNRMKVVMDNLLLERPGNTQLRIIGKKELLDSSDLLVIFKICEKTLYRWRIKQIIRFRKVSNRYYFLWIDVLPLLEPRPFQ